MSAIRPIALEGIPQFLNTLQSVDMAGAALSLVWGTASSGQAQVTSPLIQVDANGTGGGTSGQTLTLPSATTYVGSRLMIVNVGGELVTLSDSQSTKLLPNQFVWIVSGGGQWNVDTGGKAPGLMTGAYFKSTEQTGTGSSQNVAHGLGVTPSIVWWSVSQTATGTFTMTPGTHDSTNLKFTLTSGAKFYAFAIL